MSVVNEFRFCAKCHEHMSESDYEPCAICKFNINLLGQLEQKYDTLHTQFCEIHKRELFLDQEINAVKQDAFDMIREQWEEKKRDLP